MTEPWHTTSFPYWRAGLVALALVALPAVRLSGQSIAVRAVGDALHVQAPTFDFIKGDPLKRLKDGRAVRFDFQLAVLAQPGAPAVIQARHAFILSYDLWEERFAVTRMATPRTAETPETVSRSISHLTPADAETWCLDQLTVPLSALGRLGRDAPLWIRLEYRVEAQDGGASSDDRAGFTLRGLIDTLSRLRRADELKDSIEAGPLRLSRD